MKTMMTAALLSLLLGSPVLAQDTTQTAVENANQVSARITERAKKLGENLANIQEQLVNLPKDMDSAGLVFDEMIGEVKELQEALGPDSIIANGVNGLEAEARKWRDKWQKRCEETSRTTHCERVRKWEERVETAIATQARYNDEVGSLESLLLTLQDNRETVIDDMRLGLFDDAVASINASIDEIAAIRKDLEKLAEDIDDDERTGG